MRGNRTLRLLSPVLVVLVGVATFALTGGRARAAEKKVALFATGDVFAGVGNGFIKRFSPAGALLQTLDTATGCGEDLGMAFDASGNLYATAAFGGCGSGTVTKFDVNGALIGPFGSGYSQSTESITLDAAQNVFVGQPDGTKAIRKFSLAGTFLTQFTPVTSRGTDWIDMSSDQCTIVYTSEDSAIRRYNTCTSTQLANFCSACGSAFTGMRIRSNGEVLASDFSGGRVRRFNSGGTEVQFYTTAGLNTPFAVNLDPDGISFWTADYSSGQIFRINIATGAVINQFNATTIGCCLSGLAVFGELVVGVPTPTPTGTVVATATSTPVGGAVSNIPTLSASMLGLLCLALVAAAFVLMRR